MYYFNIIRPQINWKKWMMLIIEINLITDLSTLINDQDNSFATARFRGSIGVSFCVALSVSLLGNYRHLCLQSGRSLPFVACRLLIAMHYSGDFYKCLLHINIFLGTDLSSSSIYLVKGINVCLFEGV